MKDIINLVIKIKKELKTIKDINVLEKLRIKYLGKKSILNLKIKLLNKLENKEKKKKIGMILNDSKKKIQKAFIKRKNLIKQILIKNKLLTDKIDITLPGRTIKNGNIHPISQTILNIESYFEKLGFSIINSLEIEDVYHNFDALNINSNHPARKLNDTFWLNNITLLRTQTSSVQIHILKSKKPPIKIISSGRVYRNDYDKNHTPMFHQIEGLFIDKNINFVNLKILINNFIENFFEKKIKLRFRPSYFPFTEPSAEVDIMNKNKNWIEVLGCGMVHTTILKKFKIDSTIYSGFAFGLGIERLTMLYYGIKDIRLFFENDLRFIKQFK